MRMSRVEVDVDNEHVVRAHLYPTKTKSHRWKYDSGDRVRIEMQRRPSCKRYLDDWSEEIFEIVSCLPTKPVTYELADLAGERIKGTFYEPEIQKVLKSDDDRFDLDRKLKTRKRNGNTVSPLLVGLSVQISHGGRRTLTGRTRWQTPSRAEFRWQTTC